jgi:hypothetical protein
MSNISSVQRHDRTVPCQETVFLPDSLKTVFPNDAASRLKKTLHEFDGTLHHRYYGSRRFDGPIFKFIGDNLKRWIAVACPLILGPFPMSDPIGFWVGGGLRLSEDDMTVVALVVEDVSHRRVVPTRTIPGGEYSHFIEPLRDSDRHSLLAALSQTVKALRM